MQAMAPGITKANSGLDGIVWNILGQTYVPKQLTEASLPEIGRQFGGKHHTTVIHSVNKIQNDRQNDPELNKLINTLLDALQ